MPASSAPTRTPPEPWVAARSAATPATPATTRLSRLLARMVHALSAFLMTALVLLLLSFLAAATLPRLTSLEVLTVRSGSMEPVLNTGGMVVIDRELTSPQLADVVTFRMDGDLVTHRIHEILPDGLVTKGDANRTPDVGLRSPDDVVGTVVFDLPYAGFVLAFLRQPFIFLGLLTVAGSYLLGSEVMVLYRFIFRRGVPHGTTTQ